VQATQMPIATPTPVPTETPVPAETVRPGYEMKEVLVGTVISEANTSVRQGPGTEYGAVTYLAPGKTCIVLDEHMEWYKIQYEDVIGYIANEYLSVAEMTTQVPIATPTPVPTEIPDVSRTAAPGYEFVEQKIGTVNSQININVREGAGTRYDTLMQLAPGESRVVLGEEGDWYRLDLNGRIGYAAKEYITISTQLVEVPITSKKPEATGAPTASAQETLRPGYEWVERIEGTLNAQKETNVRKGPGTGYDVLTQMNPGQTCCVLGEENGWYRIEFNGQRGYILKDYISTRSYREQVEIVEEDPLDAELFNLSAPHALERRGSFTLRGVIYSNIPLTGVKLTVYNLRSMTEEMTTTVSFHHDEGITEYDLVELDGDMRFGRLTAGEKRMTITATSRDDVRVLDEIEFTVLGEADEEVSMTDACGFTASIGRADRVTDRKYSTAWMPERVGEMLIITVPQSKEADTITIEWETAPSSFELILDGTVLPVENEKEMLHFNFAVHGAKEIKIRATDKKAGICEIRVYEAGAVPTVVENWQPAGDQVDMMVVAAHPGDEFLFFGGAIPHAAAEGKSVLVVYAADCGRERMAEAMDGLWAVGVTTHPVCLGLKNGNPDDVEEAMDMWGLEDTYELMTETIRKYKPAVVLSHDINGEDEDPQHKLTSTTLRRALLLATDPDTYPASVSKYGVWSISKAYIHRYEGNVLTFDADLPLAMLNGATLREMTMIGFNKHTIVADDFDLEDGERYDPYSYGLILTNVEADDVRKDSFFENIGENAEETDGQ
ncbi:MAG: SH3 domain-containing protein, partial [Clostridia bacterium]|nr:SH3 domain-containing protein [Clostridia bacterium]